jgi:acetolactate synthase I/II/III large subunit
VFPDVDFAPIAEAFGFEAATICTLEDLHEFAPKLRKHDGPLLLDCNFNAPTSRRRSCVAHFEGRH